METGTITDVSATYPDGPARPVYTYFEADGDAGICAIENYVSEVLYRVYYGENEKGQYTIADITIEFMLEDCLELDAEFCNPTDPLNPKTFLLTQNFGIEFSVVRNVAGVDLTTLQAIADTGKVTRSGNPGYQLNQPLIVGEKEDSNKIKEVKLLGTYINGPDNMGNCLAKELSDGPSQRLDFGKHQSISCFKQFTGVDALTNFEAFCKSETERVELEIFAQFLDRFQYVSIFGNPNISFNNDWKKPIIAEAAEGLKKAGTYDAERKACKLTAGLDVEIITSRVGYFDHMQNYVVGIRILPTERDWVFAESSPDAPQEFSLYVSLAFIEILPKELESSGYSSFSLIKGNLFYPFEIPGGATANFAAQGAMAILATVAMLQF